MHQSGAISVHTRGHIYSVVFAGDGKEVLSGGVEGTIRRWRVCDGTQVGEPIRTAKNAEIYAIALSPDCNWLACGLRNKTLKAFGRAAYDAALWDARTHSKVFDIKDHTNSVYSVDFSPDSTKFATGGSDHLAFIWSTTGEKLVGPLWHDGAVGAVRFSPTGDRIAIGVGDDNETKSIHIYDSSTGQQLLVIPSFPGKYLLRPLAWSANGSRLFSVSHNLVRCWDTSSGALLSKWSVPGGPGGRSSVSIALSLSQKFIAVVVSQSLSFWDAVTHQQIGTTIEHPTSVSSIALSPSDECVATGEESGEITFRNLRDILPASYFVTKLPFMELSNAAFKTWQQGDLTGVEGLLTREIAYPRNPSHHAQALACRAIVRSRLVQWDMAVDDSRQSIAVQRSILGQIANAIALIANGDHGPAMRAFDLVFTDGNSTENKLLLLLKASILFWGEKHDDALSRIDNLIDIVEDKSLYITVRAYMLFHLGGLSMREGDSEQAVKLLSRAKEAIPFQQDPHLVLISLIFGWDFDGLDLAIQQHLQGCIKPLESHGDATLSSNPNKAILHYTAAFSLNPSNSPLLIKRSKARAMSGFWDDALEDANEAIKADAVSPWGYERRCTALYGLQRYDEAIDAFNRMLSLIEHSPDPDTRRLGRKYISPAHCEKIIDDVIHEVFRITPLVLIEVESGRLCDGPERTRIFKSEPQCKELMCSITEELDRQRVHNVVEAYFQYVTFSHVWEGKEPSFQDVNLAGSVWELESSPSNEKLKKFCEMVRSEGYRWAWSDTCCIDKTISTVLNQSLMVMYKWYEASAATVALLASAPSPSSPGDLTESLWMTRAWTAQEILAARVIRFYDRDWKPYLGDTRFNHKESPEIMRELANAIGITRETIINFNPDDLSVRDKLRLASSRKAMIEEDAAYSLIGVFKSDIRPHYGEGDAALGHLLEEIVARSGEVTVLDWVGKSSSYNSCLPATLAVYGQNPHASPAIDDARMDTHITALRDSLPRAQAMQIYHQVTHLPPARFGNRRLHLPCVLFSVAKLAVRDFGHGNETHYRARVLGIGEVDFQTADRLSLTEPRRLVLVHPWLRDLRDPLLDGLHWARTAGDDEDEDEDDDDDDASESGSGPEIGAGSASSAQHARPISCKIDDDVRALRLIARLQQPFCALLLQRQPNGEYRRVAAEHEIVVPGIERVVHLARDVHVDVVEVL